ncbi:BRO-N domain-containing protein [Dyella japonica]|uniref:BRO-N domain-containing protein n=1 Tax=Dyella japonica TaxID=231455 RepID=UPI0006995058|nr:BRO family protein [Dyella japonica]
MSAIRLPDTVQFGSVSLPVIDRAGTPWLTAADLARALGYKGRASHSATASNRIADIHRRRASEFSDDMTQLVRLPTAGGEQEVRIFSPRGCWLIAMFARTPRAAEFRHWVLNVLESLRGTPAPDVATMTDSMREQIRAELEAVLERICGRTPERQQLVRYRQLASNMAEELRTARLALTHAERLAKELEQPLALAKPTPVRTQRDDVQRGGMSMPLEIRGELKPVMSYQEARAMADQIYRDTAPGNH